MRGHVLIVEDNEDGRDALQLLLEHWGYRVDVARSGNEALARVAERRPGAIILDMGLPGMDGCQVVRCLRRDGYDGFVLGYSAFSTPEQPARRAGCDAYILKPAVEPLRELLEAAERGSAVA